ncbi:MAG: hypothetical protein HYY57_07610 [Candidatus Omnitrophica bacterium]|nr:hypothetical protein [Candidatus Omnitrophota bacterium]
MKPHIIAGVMVGALGVAAGFGLYVPQAWAVGGGSCTAGSWVDQGCGTVGCNVYRMGQTRTVTPSGCTNDTQCVNHSSCCSCTGWVSQGCGVGGCSTVQRHETRTCTPAGCLSESRCVNDTACGYAQPLPPPGTWVPYGSVMPGDPDYGFPAVESSPGVPLYKDPNLQTLVGFAAKGNIVIGDYTECWC